MSVPIIKDAVERARRAEAAGWHGITFTDSQNLCPDPFVVFAGVAAGTEHIQFATGVTNVHTRHPAALATIGRHRARDRRRTVRAGHGRGDTALFHLGLPADADRGVLRAHRTAPDVPRRWHHRHRRARRAGSAGSIRRKAGKVPLDIAASGPKVIDFSAAHGRADHVRPRRGSRPGRMGHRSRPRRRGRRRSRSRRPHVRLLREHRLPSRSRRGPGDGPRQCGRVRPLLVDAGLDRRRPGRTGPGHRGRGRAPLRQQPAPPQRRRRTPPSSPGSSSTGSRSPAHPIGSSIACLELAALGIDRFVVTGPGFGADRDDGPHVHRVADHRSPPALDLTQPTRRWRCRADSALHRHHSRPAPPGDGDVGSIAHYIAIASGRASRESLRFGEMTARNGDRPAIRTEGLTKRFGDRRCPRRD